MRLSTRTRLQSLCLCLAAILLNAANVAAQTTAFTYQGRLSDGGAPANGVFDLRFTVFDLLAGGTVVGPALTNTAVAASNGLFTVSLDFGAGVFDGAARWLQVDVRTNGGTAFQPLDPRQQITATPYAIRAAQFSGAISNAQIAGTYGSTVNFSNGANTFAGTFAGNGAGLSNINAGTLGGVSAGGFWNVVGNGGTLSGSNFLGTTDNQPLELKVNGARALRLEPDSGSSAPNLIGGSSANTVSNAMIGATIAGGGNALQPNIAAESYAAIGGGSGNYVSGLGSTIAGGIRNANSEAHSVVGGGYQNTNSGSSATLAGGANNRVSGASATLSGGIGNVASGYSPTLAGGSGNVASGNYSAIAGGDRNTNSGPYSVVAGGQQKTATGFHIALGGGSLNQASGNWAALGGGNNNTNTGEYATIAGGRDNSATYSYSTVGGGFANRAAYGGTVAGGTANRAEASSATVGGGWLNRATAEGVTIAGGSQNNSAGSSAAIGGGAFNRANGSSAVIAGGYDNRANAHGAAVGGGALNFVDEDYGTVGGGNQNSASGPWATVGGGLANDTQGASATVGGGQGNWAHGGHSTVPGGYNNVALGENSFAAGRQAGALHHGAFVWADRQEPNFPSTGTNQFLIRAGGGVGIGTNAPVSALHVAGTVTAQNFSGPAAGLTGLNASQLTSGSIPASAIGGTYGNAVTFNNGANSFNGSGAGLTSLNASQLTTGTVPDARLAANVARVDADQTYTGANTFTGANDFSGANTHSGSATFTGPVRVTGVLRSGTEAGTTQPPAPTGLVVRRINSTDPNAGQVIARTDNLTLERDNTYGGFLIRYPAGAGYLTIACMGMDNTGATRNFYTNIADTATAGTVQIYGNSQAVVHFQCSFGRTYAAGQHLTQVTLSRYSGDNYWSGTVTSTFNQ